MTDVVPTSSTDTIDNAAIEAQVQFAADIVHGLLRQAHRGTPDQAALLHDLQRIQGYLSQTLQLFKIQNRQRKELE